MSRVIKEVGEGSPFRRAKCAFQPAGGGISHSRVTKEGRPCHQVNLNRATQEGSVSLRKPKPCHEEAKPRVTKGTTPVSLRGRYTYNLNKHLLHPKHNCVVLQKW